MEFLILVGLIVLNGIFAMSEIAIVTARKSRLVALEHSGSKGAAIALRLAENPTQFLSTVQIGITSIGILNGIFGEAILAAPLSLQLQAHGIDADIASVLATTLVVVVVTYTSIVIGELVPKRMGQVSAESIACVMAAPMLLLAKVTRPFVWLLSHSTHALMSIIGFGQKPDDALTHEDIQAVLLEGSSTGVIETHEHEMVKNVFRLDERAITSLMVPRSDIAYLNINHPQDLALEKVMATPHSRFPVCRDSVDDVIGVVSAKQLLAESLAGKPIDFAKLAKPPQFVPESLTGMELLEHFRNNHAQMVFVVDEYGDIKGLATLQDMMDALTGVIGKEMDSDHAIVRRADGSYLLDGLLSILELKDALGIRALPDEAGNHYQTLNGLVMYLLGRIPKTAETLVVDAWQLEIVDMDGQRIDKVLASRIAP